MVFCFWFLVLVRQEACCFHLISYAPFLRNVTLTFNLCLGNQKSSLVEWLNYMLPHLSLPTEASTEELRACLLDGTVLCSILNRLCPGSLEMVGPWSLLCCVFVLFRTCLRFS